MKPVFVDLETRSACDLKAAGGWNYAQHPTTSLLTVSWSPEPDVFYLWLPTVDEYDRDYLRPPSDQLLHTHLDGVRVLYGPDVPDELKAVTNRPWAAHNAMTFDKIVWEALMPADAQPVSWEDTYPLALACGLPGGLNNVGKALWGEGKYEDGNTIAKDATRAKDADTADPRNVPIGALIQVGRYNVQDVRLLGWLWEELERSLDMPESEREVLRVHHVINTRGVQVDGKLLSSLSRLSTDCRIHALAEIKELTGGFLSTQKDLNSRTKVFKWLDMVGVDVGKSLRKEIIQKYIEKHTSRDEVDFPEEAEHDQEEEADADIKTTGLPLAIQVLELRMSAMKITDSKLAAASQTMDRMGQARFLFAYWAAHTGRWAGRRIQVHNLPKPKEGVDVWGLLDVFETYGSLPYEVVKSKLPLSDPLYRFLTVDDAASALIRSLFIGGDEPLAMADLANIEARVLAWLADEKWLMTAFWDGLDPYIPMAERVMGPKEKWPQFPDPKKPGEYLSLKKHPYRQLGKVLELGSGFQLGEARTAMYAAQNGVDLTALGTSPRECVQAYRGSHSKIAGVEAGEFKGRKYYRGGFWEQLNNAAIAAVETRVPQIVGRLVFEMKGPHLTVLLPSGRRLVYRSARLAHVVPSYAKGTGKTVLSVMYASPRFGWNTLYGGKIAENVTQAVARDFLAFALVLCEAAGIPVVLHVHDEVVGKTGNLPLFMKCVTTLPPWAKDFPLDAEGNLAPRYAKSPPPGVHEVVWRNGGFLK